MYMQKLYLHQNF